MFIVKDYRRGPDSLYPYRTTPAVKTCSACGLERTEKDAREEATGDLRTSSGGRKWLSRLRWVKCVFSCGVSN